MSAATAIKEAMERLEEHMGADIEIARAVGAVDFWVRDLIQQAEAAKSEILHLARQMAGGRAS
ncbi:hypothetical protein L2U69_11970 [Zavarzinia compransoris]|uniref:hypothetical protein n=1 Tax=Zavarzinia marina TaxID=2911065 RepID=UPI001F34BEE2|nr:hypothetical protein [Zavarzinia marina]MCF4166363.1 hypothetical protein [Zavarzinia marina]